MRRRNALAGSAAIVALLCATGAAAPAVAQGLQTGRIVIEAVAAVTTSSSAADDPFVFLDLTTTMRVNESLDVIVRPWARRLPGNRTLSSSAPTSTADATSAATAIRSSAHRTWTASPGWA